MKPIRRPDIETYTNPKLTDAFIQRIGAILKSDLDDLLPENPYLLPAAHVALANNFVNQALYAHLQAAQTEFINDLLCDLAIFVAKRTCDARLSTIPGVDLEFTHCGVHYLVSIQAVEPRENDESQQDRTRVLRQAVAELSHAAQPVLGYCYGRSKTCYVGGCLKVVGPNFWGLISESEHLYTDIIEVVRRMTLSCRDALAEQEARANNRLLKQFITRYCDKRGAYDPVKFVEHNSCDFDLTAFLPKS